MSDLNKEQVLCEAVAEFDNPIEALGIVMREADIRFGACGDIVDADGWTLFDVFKSGNPMADTTGQDILNTLKEGE